VTRCARLLLFAASLLASAGGAAQPDEAPVIQFGADYTLDTVVVDAGKNGRNSYLLDNLNLTADVNFDRLAGWSGGSGHVHLLNNLGDMPNNRTQTLQGIDNIEVSSQRLRLFEAWLEQKIGSRASARVGLYDMNSEFYSNEAAGSLLAPAFGVGSEIAATGPNGPSIFPSTALALRLDTRIGARGYARTAIINAEARTIGDPRGIDVSFRRGALVIGEAGLGEDSKVALGVWTYTRRQDSILAGDGVSTVRRRSAHGGYFIVQQSLNNQEGPWATQAFVRAGLSDGKTTAFRGGWQAGVMILRPLVGRPEGVLSIGANQAYLARDYRRLLNQDGIRSTGAETAIEVTYVDTILPHVTLQPDVQWITRPAGERTRDDVFAFTLRLGIAY
jgi:porin